MTPEKIVWAKRNTKRAITPLLLARRISNEWLETSFETIEVRFQGKLLAAMVDLRDAAKQLKPVKNLPIGSLRLMLQAGINGLISVEKNLGCDTDKGLPAITLYASEETDAAIANSICEQLARWHMNVLEPWAQRQGDGLGGLAARVGKVIAADGILLARSELRLRPRADRPNFSMIVRRIADQLAGESLFPGMGPCELVLPEYGNVSTLELMTPPRRSARDNSSFSMVARIVVSTVPYSADLYLTISAAKRVWAEKMPTGGNTGDRATAYVMIPGCPSMPVAVVRQKDDGVWKWDFDDDYAAIFNESKQELAATLDKALASVAYADDRWWVGLPQTTRLYSRIASRTVFEGDEKDLLDAVEPCLAGILDGEVNFVSHRVSLNGKPASTMLRAEDLGVAGTAIADDQDDAGGEDEASPEDGTDGERDEIASFRRQCTDVLGKIHPDAKPHLWIVGGTDREQSFIRRAAELLFGEAIGISIDPLPAGVHNLKANLPGKELKSRQRFELRVEAWKQSGLPAAIAAHPGPKHVLICAAKEIGRQSEDPVNRRAAIHAMCSIAKASVHHLLPIEDTTSEYRAGKAVQSFIHRAQSAMMDVLLAHSGYIIGAGEFVRGQLAGTAPKAIYGIQALRKNAQKFSGETPVCMVIYSRLDLASNVTEIQFGFKQAGKTQRSPWMRLAAGLIWLGAQRSMQGDETWLEQEFQGLTQKVLAEVGEQDPRAIVLIDWQTLPRLWRELTDENLTSNDQVRLGHANLESAFPQMSFVRLRYGFGASMPLRAWRETMFEGFREGAVRVSTGAFSTDAYVTTKKQLIELNPGQQRSGRSHFIGVMTYPKTTQVLRGLSCYRTTVRMIRDKGDKGVFEEVAMPPADFDAALPTSMDITVMHAPEDLAPAAIATIVMGLRLGYAHYPDWTRLPAPLFFERKIDDYIIKYPATDDDDGEALVGEVLDDAEEADEVPESSSVLQIVADMVEKEVSTPSPAAQVEAPVQTYDVVQLPSQTELPLDVRTPGPAETVDDILAEAKSIPVADFAIYPPHNGEMRRLYEYLVKGAVDVQVELPFFVTTRGMLGRYNPSMKKRINRHWNMMVDFGLVPVVGRQRPRHEAYLDWLAGHLIRPQTAYIIDSVILFDRDIILPELARAVSRYNATAREPIPLTNSRRAMRIDLSPLVQRVIEEGDDDTLAWMVFAAAQTPSFGIAETVIQNISVVLGRRTEAALHYYVNSAAACKQAIAQAAIVRTGKFRPIHYENTFVSRFPETPVIETQTAVVEDEETFVAIHASMHTLIGGLVPGADGFAGNLQTLIGFTERLSAMDDTCRQRVEQERESEKLIDALSGEAAQLIERILQMDVDHQFAGLRFVMPTTMNDEVESALREEIRGISSTIDPLVKARTEWTAFDVTPLPPKASFAEKARHAKQANDLLSRVIARFADVEGALKASSSFVLESTGAEPAGDAAVSTVPAEGEVPAAETIPAVEHPASIPVEGSAPSADATAAVDTPINHQEVAGVPVPGVTAGPEPAPEDSPAVVAPGDQPPAMVAAEPSAGATRSDAVHALAVIPEVVADAGRRGTPANDDVARGDDQGMVKSLAMVAELVTRRHYALAGAYVGAIRVAFSDDKSLHLHGPILESLCDTLDSIDCRFSVDTRMRPDLRELLLQPVEDAKGYGSHAGSAVGVLAASLVSMLFSSPDGGSEDIRWSVIDWVRQPLTGRKALSNLVAHIGLIDSKRITLTREKFVISRVGDKLAQEAETRRSIARAERWKTDPSIHSGWAHQGYLRMHEHIYGLGHPIGQCLALVAKGDFKNLREAYNKAKRKFDKPSATIVEAFKAAGERGKPDGRYGVNAAENITITENFIKQCIDRHESKHGLEGSLAKHESEYLDRLAGLLTAAIHELENEMTSEPPMDVIYVLSAIAIFKAVLRLFDDVQGDFCIPDSQQRLLIQLPMDRAYMPSIATSEQSGMRAICSAEDVMHAIDDLMENDIRPLNHPVSEADMVALLNDALKLHVEEQRFLPAFAIAATLGPSIRIEPPLMQQYQKTKADLGRELQDARQRVTHAMALSALTQSESSDLLRIIERLGASNIGERAIGHPQGTSSAYPDFPHALSALRTEILQVLDTRLQETRDKLDAELNAYSRDHGDEARHDVQRVRDMLATNNPASLRTAHDACTILRNGGRLPAYVFNREVILPTEFEAFLKSLDEMHGHHVMIDTLQEKLKASSDDACADCISHLSAEERKEAADFLQKWKDLCIERSPHVVAELAGKFFAALGISAPDYIPPATRAVSRHTRLTFPDKAFSALATNVSFIPPALGSPTQSVVGFVVQGNQPENDIASLIQDVSGVPTFILARTRLTLGRRARISGHAPVVLIDDNLVAYMALRPDDRARRMMEIGTLTFYTHPYSADGTSVPKEMFFGRRRELDGLRNVKSLAILYGGRRLGKSSLLAQIEREMNSDAGTVAVYIPMNRDYHGGDHVTFAWRTLYRALVAREIIQPMAKDSTDWQTISSWVEQQLTAASQTARACYFLFDEADDLMARELDLKPGDVGLIGSLHHMAERIQSKISVRYVIAGLHNLTRMTTESNSALGKAEVIALEPFSTDDDILRGIDLITRPMAALGFYFGAGCEDLPLQILSVCNYYPAFIQVYCKKLLEHMYNKRPKDQAIAYVTARDLDAVEKDHDLLTELQTKFGWTLDLDKRYKAIALVLADTYYSEIEVGKNEGLSVGAIREFCQMVAEPHFRGMSFGAYESLVDEMRKLNVLEKHGSNYRLRNPSIAMLIGDRERINHQLAALASEPPEKARNQGDRRQVMEQGSAHVLFPMPIAWVTSQMDVIDGELIILAGNHLSGLNDLCQPAAVWPLTQNSRFQAMGLTATAASQVINKYRGQAGASLLKGGKLFLAATATTWKVGEIGTFASLAQKAAPSRIRLALIASPDRLWELSRAMSAGTLARANKKAPWQVVPVPPWSVDAVRFYVHENVAVSDNTEACDAIIRASCGFTRPIQTICAGNLTADIALKAPAASRQMDFARDLASFYTSIGMPQAIDAATRKRMEEFMVLVHNESRSGSVIDDGLQSCGLVVEDMLFLHWIGLLQEGENNTWSVPELYLSLIS